MSLARLKSAKNNVRGKIFPHIPIDHEPITVDDSGEYRTYTLSDGTTFYSMTSMLSMTSDKDWLIEWRKRVGDEAADAEMERCANRGEGVHLACEYYLNNEPMEKCIAAAGDYVNLFYQLKPVLDERVIAVITQEIPLYSRVMRVAGRVDLICIWKLPDGSEVLAVVDFKTSNWQKLKGEIEDYQCQLAGYARCFYEMTGRECTHLVNIIACECKLVPDVIPFTTKESLPILARRIRQFHTILGE